VSYSRCTVCGTERTRAEWRALPLVGVWVLDEGSGPTVLESRNCPHGGGIAATITVDLLAVDVPPGSDPADIRSDVLIDALADLQAELSRFRAVYLNLLLEGARRTLAVRSAPAAPHLSQIGRDPPGYAYLARAVLERNDAESLEDDLRHELRTAYADGRNAIRTELAAAELAGEDDLHTRECLEYAAKTKKAFCIAACADARRGRALRGREALEEALAPLVAIADAYDDNELDDEARKRWGKNLEHENQTPPEDIELYSGRGGAQLLTLRDCLRAREAVRGRR
jgi:hypothetical protein